MHFEQAYQDLMGKLEKELSPQLTYHNVGHTRDVVSCAKHLMVAEGLEASECEILKAAALFHDAGFLKGYDEHEMLSCEVAREMLPNYGYSPQQIEAVCRLIMVTKLPQKPETHAEEILCDADLYYLGTDQYTDGANGLAAELKAFGKMADETDWIKFQIDFLKKHRFFTLTAVKEQNARKNEHVQQLLIMHELEKVRKGKRKPLLIFLQDAFLILFGVLVAGFALKGFLVPNHFFDGGITGISLLIHEVYHYNLGYVIVLANLPLVVLSYYTVGKRFAFKTFVCVLLLGIALLFIPYPTVTSDKLLISIFGGFFIGLGVGLIMRAGAALDGIEILAIKAFRKTPFTVTEVILAINIGIFSIAAFLLGMETALYSVLTYFTATKTIDFVVEGIEAYTGVTIISGKSELIKYRLVNEMSRGITVYKGERGFLPGKFEVSSDCDIIFTIITRLELRKLKNLVYEVDPRAFVFANTIRDASGGILKRRASH